MTAVGGLSRQLGLRHLRERGLRTTLTAAGVAAGVALLSSIGAMNAVLVSAVRSTATAFAGRAALQVQAASPGGLLDTMPRDLAAVPGVAAAVPVLEVRSHIAGRRGGKGVFVLGVTPDIAAVAPSSQTKARFGGGAGVILSDRLARDLGASLGDTVAIDAPGGTIGEHVTGIVSSPVLARIDGGAVVVMALPTAQTIFDRKGRVDTILLVAQPHTPMAPLQTAVAAHVGGAGVVTTPSAAPGASNQNVNPFVLLTDTIGLLSLFVAVVLVFNTMSMALAERRQELSMARAFGATPRQLFGAVVVEAAVLGAAGTVVGIVAGGFLARALVGVAGHAYRTVLPIDAPTGGVWRVGPVLVAAAAGLVASVLGAVLPARRALRAAAIDALRPVPPYEWRSPAGRDGNTRVAVLGAVLLAGGAALGALLPGTFPSPGLTAVAVVSILAGITFLLPSAVPLGARVLASGFRRLWGTVGRLAGDALCANPRRTSLTTATLILPLAMVVGLGTAFGSAQAKFARLADTFVVAPIVISADSFVGYTATQPLPEADRAALAAVPGVRAVLASQNIFLTIGGHQAILYAVPLRAAARAGVAADVQDQQLSPDPEGFRAGLERGQIAVSRLAAHERHLAVGGTVALPAPSGLHSFTVAAVFDDLAGEDTFYVDRDTYVALWGDTGAYRFSLVPDPSMPVSVVMSRVAAAVRAVHMPAQVQTRDEATQQLKAGLGQIFSLARAIQLAALIVAGLSLASTAFTTVLERRWTLGLQRALGMSRLQIARSLLLEAAAVGVLGSAGAGAIGLAIAVLLVRAFSIRVASPMHVVLPWPLLAACGAAGIAISVLATLYPRRLARRVTIIDSLRYE